MEKKFITQLGEVTAKVAMIDTGYHTIEQGIDFSIDGEFVCSVIGPSLDELNDENIVEMLGTYYQ